MLYFVSPYFQTSAFECLFAGLYATALGLHEPWKASVYTHIEYGIQTMLQNGIEYAVYNVAYDTFANLNRETTYGNITQIAYNVANNTVTPLSKQAIHWLAMNEANRILPIAIPVSIIAGAIGSKWILKKVMEIDISYKDLAKLFIARAVTRIFFKPEELLTS